MEIGAILTRREAEQIRKRINNIRRKSDDRKTQEQCRLIVCMLSKAGRRVDRLGTNEPKLF